jgi:hypothetical protein
MEKHEWKRFAESLAIGVGVAVGTALGTTMGILNALGIWWAMKIENSPFYFFKAAPILSTAIIVLSVGGGFLLSLLMPLWPFPRKW